jgi:hypothetical protein
MLRKIVALGGDHGTKERKTRGSDHQFESCRFYKQARADPSGISRLVMTRAEFNYNRIGTLQRTHCSHSAKANPTLQIPRLNSNACAGRELAAMAKAAAPMSPRRLHDCSPSSSLPSRPPSSLPALSSGSLSSLTSPLPRPAPPLEQAPWLAAATLLAEVCCSEARAEAEAMEGNARSGAGRKAGGARSVVKETAMAGWAGYGVVSPTAPLQLRAPNTRSALSCSNLICSLLSCPKTVTVPKTDIIYPPAIFKFLKSMRSIIGLGCSDGFGYAFFGTAERASGTFEHLN